ncbi:MAG: putative sulfate exporter family transporter [Anaerolineae bacterium]|nr:putative sulfate exporter family transporter [Anaerolineae bacterium]
MASSVAGKTPSQLERMTLGVPLRQVPSLVPGLIASGLVAWVGLTLADWIGVRLLGFRQNPISPIMVAIVVGLAVSNLTRTPRVLQPGVRFSVRKLLRLGIILLGIRLSLLDVARVGAYGVPVVALCIAAGLVFTGLLVRRLRLPERLGTLIAVGTGICGLSAIVATAPCIEAEDEEVAYAAANITIFGALATFLYPYLAQALFGLDAARVGLFLGTSVHDTSQVVASSLIFDQVFLPDGPASAADVAVVIKMVRNVFMAAVVPLMAYRYARGRARRAGGRVEVLGLLPLFVVGFLAVAALRSIGDAGLARGGLALGLWNREGWGNLIGSVKGVAENLLLAALAAVGLSTDFGFLRRLGPRPFLVGFAAALMVGVVSAALAVAFGPLIRL